LNRPADFIAALQKHVESGRQRLSGAWIRASLSGKAVFSVGDSSGGVLPVGVLEERAETTLLFVEEVIAWFLANETDRARARPALRAIRP
jgi:hypothetical protein